MAAEARIDRHQQDHINMLQHIMQMMQRRGRIKHQPGLAAGFLDQPQGAINMLAGLGVKRHIISARRRKGRDEAIHRLDHQVYVQRGGDPVITQGGHQHRAEGQVGHVMVIHHINVDHISTSGENGGHLIAQTGNIGRQNGWGNKVVGHRCVWAIIVQVMHFTRSAMVSPMPAVTVYG